MPIDSAYTVQKRKNRGAILMTVCPLTTSPTCDWKDSSGATTLKKRRGNNSSMATLKDLVYLRAYQ